MEENKLKYAVILGLLKKQDYVIDNNVVYFKEKIRGYNIAEIIRSILYNKKYDIRNIIQIKFINVDNDNKIKIEHVQIENNFSSLQNNYNSLLGNVIIKLSNYSNKEIIKHHITLDQNYNYIVSHQIHTEPRLSPSIYHKFI